MEIQKLNRRGKRFIRIGRLCVNPFAQILRFYRKHLYFVQGKITSQCPISINVCEGGVV